MSQICRGNPAARLTKTQNMIRIHRPNLVNVQRKRQLVRASKQRSSEEQLKASEDVSYEDGPTDIAFIALCRKAYGNLAGWQSEKSWTDGAETYAGMVEVSRMLMKGKSAEEQQTAVIAGFPQVPGWFRKLFPYSKWGAELNAWITPVFFRWLVGPMERRETEVNGQVQKSAVHITKCRYLAESKCAGMCVNLCKSPVQTFFTRELGMPLTMKPNFEDYSCEMVFGEVPPPAAADEAYAQPCIRDCPTGRQDSKKCVKLQ